VHQLVFFITEMAESKIITANQRSLPAVLLVTAPQGMSVVMWGNPTSMKCKVNRLHQPADSQHAHCIFLGDKKRKLSINHFRDRF